MASLKVVNPFDQSVACEMPYAQWDEIEKAVQDARAAFSKWRLVKVEERVRLVREAFGYFEAHRDEVARDLTRQMGKPLRQSGNEINGMRERWMHMCDIAAEALAPEPLPPKENFERAIAHEPVGVVLDIAAWNYPLLIAVNVIVPALLAGNTVLVKHSSRTPLCGEHFQLALASLGGHKNLLRNLVMDHASTERLLTEGLVDYTSFTGSVPGGYSIYAAAARHFIDAGLELGGKDPAYVAEDADLDFAVANIVDGAMYNAGQSCCGIERVYVHESLYEAFVEKAEALVRDYRLGDPMDEQTTLGPLASPSSLDDFDKQIAQAVGAGARLVCGGRRADIGKGNFYEATLIADIPDNSLDIMQEENFGPIMPVMKVSDDDEALHFMNDSALGLTASVWTASLERGRRLAAEIQAGTVYMNRCDYLDPGLPWTARKESGKGASLSPWGFYAMTRLKSLHFRTRTA